MTDKEREIRNIIERSLECVDWSLIPDKNINIEEQCSPCIRNIQIIEFGIGPNIIVDGVSVLDLSIDF